MEQTTIVHEIGHTIGLVNSGIPMHNDHEDLNHPDHTTNSEGVMYWAIENSKNILSILSGTISRRELNLFKSESMADVKYFKP